MVYSSFSYTPTGADPAAAQIDIGIDNNTGLFQTGLQLQTSGGLVWTSGFTLDYTVTIDAAACAAEFGSLGGTCTLTAAQLAFQGALAPNDAAMSAVLTPGGTINVNDLVTGNNVNQIKFAGVTSETIAITGVAGTVDPIDTFGLDNYQTVVPEPASLGLIGGGLFVLGLLRRKKVSRQ